MSRAGQLPIQKLPNGKGLQLPSIAHCMQPGAYMFAQIRCIYFASPWLRFAFVRPSVRPIPSVRPWIFFFRNRPSVHPSVIRSCFATWGPRRFLHRVNISPSHLVRAATLACSPDDESFRRCAGGKWPSGNTIGPSFMFMHLRDP